LLRGLFFCQSSEHLKKLKNLSDCYCRRSASCKIDPKGGSRNSLTPIILPLSFFVSNLNANLSQCQSTAAWNFTRRMALEFYTQKWMQMIGQIQAPAVSTPEWKLYRIKWPTGTYGM